MQGRGGRPDDGRGWEGRKQRREARADGSGASAGSRASVGVRGEGRVRGERRGAAVRRGEREWGFGRKRGGMKQGE